jgi:hypothetical protein
MIEIVRVWQDGTTGGYVVEELLELRPISDVPEGLQMDVREPLKNSPSLYGCG